MKNLLRLVGLICFLQISTISKGQSNSFSTSTSKVQIIFIKDINIVDVENNKTIPHQFIAIKGERIIEIVNK